MPQSTEQKNLVVQIEEATKNEDHKQIVSDPWRDQIAFATTTEAVLAQSIERLNREVNQLDALRERLDITIKDKQRVLASNRSALSETMKYKAALEASKVDHD